MLPQISHKLSVWLKSNKIRILSTLWCLWGVFWLLGDSYIETPDVRFSIDCCDTSQCGWIHQIATVPMTLVLLAIDGQVLQMTSIQVGCWRTFNWLGHCRQTQESWTCVVDDISDKHGMAFSIVSWRYGGDVLMTSMVTVMVWQRWQRWQWWWWQCLRCPSRVTACVNKRHLAGDGWQTPFSRGWQW